MASLAKENSQSLTIFQHPTSFAMASSHDLWLFAVEIERQRNEAINELLAERAAEILAAAQRDHEVAMCAYNQHIQRCLQLALKKQNKLNAALGVWLIGFRRD